MTKSAERAAMVARALMALAAARDLLVRADCPRAADKVRKALKSAEGAYRHTSGGFSSWRHVPPRQESLL